MAQYAVQYELVGKIRKRDVQIAYLQVPSICKVFFMYKIKYDNVN